MQKIVRSRLFVFLVILIFCAGGIMGCSTSNKGPSAGTPQAGSKEAEAPGEKAGADSVNINLAHFFPAVHPVEGFCQLWKEAVEEATDGQVTVTTYPGETLSTAAEMYEGVATGIADAGISVFGYTAGRFPLLEVLELPGTIFNNSVVASYTTWEAIKQFQPEEVQDTKMMMAWATGPGDLYTKDPVRTLEELKGMEIRAFGLTVETLEALGAVPVAMTQAEVYEAISKGVVKGNLAPIEALEGWRQAEVTNYLTRTPFLYNATFFFAMNLDVWNSLSPEIQDTILEVNDKLFAESACKLWDGMNESALKFAVEETGMEVLELSPDEFERWRTQVMPIQERFVKDLEARGFPGKEFMDLVLELSEKYNELYG
ncbi:MAG: TRAP transporter substrate-binding protein [Dethiobacteria bacterium]|jgi:TRAP-type C4-dicarboxylate transport system substrate-binding protein